jgi:hypothetical protein
MRNIKLLFIAFGTATLIGCVLLAVMFFSPREVTGHRAQVQYENTINENQNVSVKVSYYWSE